jgi:hypothetical protein
MLLIIVFFFFFYLHGLGPLACDNSEVINYEIMNLTDSWYDTVHGGSARRKAATYTQDNTNTE